MVLIELVSLKKPRESSVNNIKDSQNTFIRAHKKNFSIFCCIQSCRIRHKWYSCQLCTVCRLPYHQCHVFRYSSHLGRITQLFNPCYSFCMEPTQFNKWCNQNLLLFLCMYIFIIIVLINSFGLYSQHSYQSLIRSHYKLFEIPSIVHIVHWFQFNLHLFIRILLNLAQIRFKFVFLLNFISYLELLVCILLSHYYFWL